MKNVLYIKSSPRGSESFSFKLAQELINKLNTHYGKLNITTVDFIKNPPSYLTGQQLSTFFAPLEHQTEEQKASMVDSNAYVEQLKNNDIIIISFPVWNFLIPSCLKAWIDQIVRPGVTFQYDGHVPKGLILGKKSYIVAASGGIYPDFYNNDTGSGYDFSVQYMKTILNYIGMKEVAVIKAQGLAIPDMKDEALEKAIQSIHIE